MQKSGTTREKHAYFYMYVTVNPKDRPRKQDQRSERDMRYAKNFFMQRYKGVQGSSTDEKLVFDRWVILRSVNGVADQPIVEGIRELGNCVGL